MADPTDIRVDFHTHSSASNDGGITAQQYTDILASGALDCVAITDHNSIGFAVKLQQKLGKNKVIVGEEISTQQGDIIGLFLSSVVSAHQDVTDAIADIRSQGGLVYIPHPFETVRKGVSMRTLNTIQKDIDIIETINGRAVFQNHHDAATDWAVKNNILMATSSDAHRAGALGKTYTQLPAMPTRENLTALLKEAGHSYKKPSLLDVMAPKMNTISKLCKGVRA